MDSHHATRAPAAFGRLALRWLIRTSDTEDPEVRASLLLTMRETSPLLALALFWAQAGALGAWFITREPWALAWIGFELITFALRLHLRRRLDRAVRAHRRPAYGALLAVNAVWLASIAVGAFGLLLCDDLRLLLLGAILCVGFSGYIGSRCAAFPRFAIGALYTVSASLTAGLILSPLPGVIWLAWLAPGVAVAFHMLVNLNHAMLVEVFRARQENRRLSMHDPLTGLPNRLLLRERLAELCRQLAGPHRSTEFAVLCLDLDGFKAVNDRFGHAGGDWLLKLVAERLAKLVRTDDVVCRIGGDEFVILLPGCDAKATADFSRRAVESLAQPCDLGGVASARVGASLGIALAPLHGRDADTLLAVADEALYAVKRAGKGSWRVAEAETRPDATTPGPGERLLTGAVLP